MTDEDPFKNVQEIGTATTAVKEPVKTSKKKAEEPADTADELAAFLAEMGSMTIDEDDLKAPEEFRSTYVKPAHNTWVPVRIVSATVEERDGVKAVVAYTDDGTMVTDPKMIDRLVELTGAEQVVENITAYQFVIEAEHVSTLFGERSHTYRLFTPVFPTRVPFRDGVRKRGGKEEYGFDKNSGKKLLAATRVAKPGVKIEPDKEKLQKMADAMVADGGAIVMARIRQVTKKATDATPRKYESGPLAGQFVKALVDKEGSPVRVAKNGDSYFYKKGGEAYTDNPTGLIPFDGDYLVPDNGDDAAIVKDISERENIFDNLSDDVFPIPGRTVTVQRAVESDEEVEIDAQVTWESVGFIATSPVKAGTLVQAVAGEGDEQETITASWLGDHWQEMQKPHEMNVTDLGEPTLLPVAGSASPDALDVFKS